MGCGAKARLPFYLAPNSRPAKTKCNPHPNPLSLFSGRGARSETMSSFSKPISFRWLIVCLGLACLSFTAHAHPPKESETEITYNERTGLVEIVRRYRVYDSEEVIQRLFDPNLSIREDSEAQSLFGEYVESRFSLSWNGAPVELEFIGGEIDDGYIWIYQTTGPLSEDGLYVMRDSSLMDVHSDQTNIVNVRLYDQVQTFIFNRSAPFVTFRLDGEDVY